jgi:hypothetical protein
MANDELDPRLAELLDVLKSVPERDFRATARGKNKFLAEAVSLSEQRRHSGWKTIFQPKEKFAMNLIVSVLVIAGLLFGSGATVAVAQDALPTDALYQVKLFSEDTQLWLNGDPAREVELLMQQAQTRTEEMAALNSQGVIPPDALTTRTQDRIQQALQVTSTLNEDQIAGILLQVRDHLRTQDRLLSQLQDGTCTDCEPILKRTRDMLHTQLQDVEDGLVDPQGFVYRHRHQNGIATLKPTEAPVTEEPTEVVTEEPIATQAPVATQEPIATENPASCPTGFCTPALDGTGQQNGAGPQNGGNNDSASGEPQNGEGAGGSGQQNGAGPQNGGNNDSASGEPQNGTGSGGGGRP